MNKILMKIGGILVVTALMAPAIMAEEKPAATDNSAAKAKKIESVEAARTQLGQTMREVQALSDTGVSGFNTKNSEISINYGKTCALLNKAIQKENAKPEAERNADHLKAMKDEQQNVSQLWSKFNQPAIMAKMNAANQRYREGLTPVCNGLYTMYDGWTKLNLSVNNCLNVSSGWTKLNLDILDMDLLKTVYELVEKSAVEVKSQQQAASDEVDAQMKVWQDALVNATSHYNTWTGENEQVAK